MASRFGIFHIQINLKLDIKERPVAFCITTYLPRRCNCFEQEEKSTENFEGNENVFVPLWKGFSRRYGQQARIIKDMYLHYSNHEGKADWQNKMVS
jgi:hypothetical protein